MKVALELQPLYWERSGIGTYTYEIAKRLKSDDSVEFVGNAFDFQGKAGLRPIEDLSMPVLVNKFLPYGVYRRIWNHIPVTYSQMFPEAELNVFFNFVVPPRIKGRVMTTVHDLTYLKYPETMKKANYDHLRKGMPYSMKRSDKVLTVSQFSKREIQKLLDVPEDKIAVVYNAPSISLNKVDFETLKKKFSIKQNYLLFVGNIEPRKNISRLLRAFELLKKRTGISHQLVIAGGKGWQNEKIFDEAAKIHCKHDVIFTGYVSAEEKNTLYENASAFVFPSLYEGFGIPPLEAMTWGCPVVCAEAASLPEVVGNAACMVDPQSFESIADGMEKVLNDDEYRIALIHNGYLRAKFFTWENSASQFTNVCKEILEVN